MDKLFLILVTLLLTFRVTHARDPDSPPPDYYGEHTTVGGSKWDGGDTFIAIVLPLTVAAMIALPHIFDGNGSKSIGVVLKNNCISRLYGDHPMVTIPVYKFMGSGERCRVFIGLSLTAANPYKFPTRRLCESY